MIMMALWPEVQEKIFAEVSRALPADADEPTSYDEVMPKLASQFLRLHQLSSGLPTDNDLCFSCSLIREPLSRRL